jgi:Tfp pilus assembly protein FimV
MKEISMNARFFADFRSGSTFKRASLALALGAWGVLAQAAEPDAKGKTYTVKPGDTLDKIVRTQMADSPLRADLLKEALVSQNPGAFTKGSTKTLMAGASLQLPNQEAIVRKHFGNAPLPYENAAGSDTQQARRHWVRYP